MLLHLHFTAPGGVGQAGGSGGALGGFVWPCSVGKVVLKLFLSLLSGYFSGFGVLKVHKGSPLIKTHMLRKANTPSLLHKHSRSGFPEQMYLSDLRLHGWDSWNNPLLFLYTSSFIFLSFPVTLSLILSSHWTSFTLYLLWFHTVIFLFSSSCSPLLVFLKSFSQFSLSFPLLSSLFLSFFPLATSLSSTSPLLPAVFLSTPSF